MKYALLIYAGTPGEEYWRTLSEDDQRAMVADYGALGKEPGIFGSQQLQPADTATTVRTKDGEILTTEGSVADEPVGGFYLLEAETLDRALEVAARIPAARLGGAVEVRPLVER